MMMTIMIAVPMSAMTATTPSTVMPMAMATAMLLLVMMVAPPAAEEDKEREA